MFFPASYQAVAGMIWAFGYCAVILVKAPYVRKFDDRIHICAQVT